MTAVSFGTTAQAGAAGWTAPLTVGSADPNSQIGEDLAMDASGAATFVWTIAGTVRAAMRSSGGGFGDSLTLAQGATSAPAVAMDGAGNALAVWSRGGSLAAAAGNGARGGLTSIGDLATGVAGTPDVAFLSGGRALVVWAATDGAVHALERDAGGSVVPLGNLSTGVGNTTPSIAATGDRAIAAWVTTETAGTTRTTRLRAALRAPGTGFGAPEEVATETMQNVGTTQEGGTDITNPVATISGGGAADIEATLVNLIGLPGDFGLESTVYTRPPAGGWGPPQPLATFDARLSHSPLTTDLVPGTAGDALYVAGESRGPMEFYGHVRGAGSTAFGPRVPVLSAPGAGEIRAAILAPRRFLTVLRLEGVLQSSTQTGSAGFAEPRTIAGSGTLRLLDAAGSAHGEAVAAWQTAGTVRVALYDDAAGTVPGGSAGRGAGDTTRPSLTDLAVSPRRFAVRRGRGRSARGGAAIRWRLNEPATVRLRIERVRSGFLRAGSSRCTARRPTGGQIRRCTRTTTVRILVRRAPVGRTSLRFGGLVRSRPLAAGRYRVRAPGTDAARNASRTRTASFTIVRRR